MPITEFSTDAYYKIFSASHEDEGSYRCTASNKIGSILSEEMKILVACKYSQRSTFNACIKILVVLFKIMNDT